MKIYIVTKSHKNETKHTVRTNILFLRLFYVMVFSVKKCRFFFINEKLSLKYNYFV